MPRCCFFPYTKYPIPIDPKNTPHISDAVSMLLLCWFQKYITNWDLLLSKKVATEDTYWNDFCGNFKQQRSTCWLVIFSFLLLFYLLIVLRIYFYLSCHLYLPYLLHLLFEEFENIKRIIEFFVVKVKGEIRRVTDQ